jgi:hypothetical protein
MGGGHQHLHAQQQHAQQQQIAPQDFHEVASYFWDVPSPSAQMQQGVAGGWAGGQGNIPGMVPGITPPNVLNGIRRSAFSFDTIPQGEHRTNPVLTGIQQPRVTTSADTMQLLAYAAQHGSRMESEKRVAGKKEKPKGAGLVL